MKYLCLCYYDPNVANALSPSDAQDLAVACNPHYEAWEKSEELLALGALSDPQACKTISPTDTPDNLGGQPIIADGPYLQGGHRIGAFFIVEAEDINQAVAIAAKHPTAHTGRFLAGGIEVCPCEAFETLQPVTSAA